MTKSGTKQENKEERTDQTLKSFDGDSIMRLYGKGALKETVVEVLVGKKRRREKPRSHTHTHIHVHKTYEYKQGLSPFKGL